MIARLEALALAGRVAAVEGRTADARLIFDSILASDAEYLSGLHLRNAAMVAAALGRADEALELLRRGFSSGLPYGMWIHAHPAFESIRESPEYAVLTAPIE